jgi:hypothetical protein
MDIWELMKICFISIVLGILITDILQTIKYYLVLKGRWWKKYPEQNTTNDQDSTEYDGDNSFTVNESHSSLEGQYQQTNSNNKTETHQKCFFIILRRFTVSGMLISFCHACIIRMLNKPSQPKKNLTTSG